MTILIESVRGILHLEYHLLSSGWKSERLYAAGIQNACHTEMVISTEDKWEQNDTIFGE